MKIVVLDRDGVINFDSNNYIRTPDEWVAIPGSLEAISRLSKFGFTVVIATNQSGLARNYFTKSVLTDIHQKLLDSVKKLGGTVNGIFYCPHSPSDDCNCRKPRTGLLEQIEERFDCSLCEAPFIGDSMKDMQAAVAFGCRPLLVKTGNGLLTLKEIEHSSEIEVDVFEDLSAAADFLIESTHA